MIKTAVLNFSASQWKQWISEQNLPSYRCKQIIEWIYRKHTPLFSSMTNLPESLRQDLSDRYTMTSLYKKMQWNSEKDVGTFKILWETQDHLTFESVMIPNSKGEYTLCLSSQAGCSMRCSFCATGLDGLSRSLKQEEILGQYFLLSMDHSISNIVFMGMGEPLLNEELFPSLSILTDPEYFGFPDRNITVSTVGILEGIQKMQEYKQIGLALSYHSSILETREVLFPVLSLRHSLEEIIDALISYHKNTKKRLTLEYLLIRGLNDTREEAQKLVELSHRFYFFLNLIPYNPSPAFSYQAPLKEEIRHFIGYFPGSFPVQIRFSKGQDIFAACGQLSHAHRKTTSNL